MFDIISWILGMKLSGGGSSVVIEGDITCTDDGEGNITMEMEGDN